MITLLSEASVSGGALELEDLAGVVGAVGLLATLADEFVGAEIDATAGLEVLPGQTTAGASSDTEGEGEGLRRRCAGGGALRECLSDKAKEFFQGANKEGVTVLKQMLEMEAWQRVPIPVKAEEGGVGGLIDANAQRFCSPHRVYRGIRKSYLQFMHDVMSLDPPSSTSPPPPPWEELGSSCGSSSGSSFLPAHANKTRTSTHLRPPQQSFFREWHRRGNPFRMIGDTVVASLNTIPEDNEAVSGGGEGVIAGVGLGRLPSGTDVDDDPDYAGLRRDEAAAAGAGAGGPGARRTGGRGVEEQLEAEEKRYGSGWVVTQAALNGVARYAGHALQIMALVRPAAPSAFEGLRQLVDLYMYCTFTMFCPQWTIDALYGFGEEELVPAPEEQERFTALKSFMSRVSQAIAKPSSGSRVTSPHHSPGRSSGLRDKDGNRAAPTSNGGVGDSGSSSIPGTGSTLRRRSRAQSTASTGNAAAAGGAAGDETPGAIAAAGAGGGGVGGEATLLAGAANHLRERAGRGSFDSSPATGGGGVARSGEAGGGDGSRWPFRGSGDSPARSRANSTTAGGAQGLFSRRGAARHPTPRAPLPLPACMTLEKSAADGLDGLLLVGSEAFWGGGGVGSDDVDAVEKTVEWKSLGQRAVAVESCLFVVQVLKAARRRTIGLGLLPLSQRAAVDVYVEEVEEVAAQLRAFAYAAQGSGLAYGAGIADAAESQTWTRKQLRNDASPYVEKWIQRCRLVHKAIHARANNTSIPADVSATATATSAATATESAASEQPAMATGDQQPSGGRTPASNRLGEGGSASARAGMKTGVSPLPSPSRPPPSPPPSSLENGAGVSSGKASSCPSSSGPSSSCLSSCSSRVDAALLVPTRARDLAWCGVVDATLLSLLRGFSRARRCSTEGRALMSMDLQALALGLEDPAAAQVAKAHVHAYVNAFYFGEDDLHKWIKERWRSYPMYQMVSLLQCGDGSAASGVLRKRRVKDLVVQVEALYLPWKSGANANKNASPDQGNTASSAPTNGVTSGAVVVAVAGGE